MQGCALHAEPSVFILSNKWNRLLLLRYLGNWLELVCCGCCVLQGFHSFGSKCVVTEPVVGKQCVL